MITANRQKKGKINTYTHIHKCQLERPLVVLSTKGSSFFTLHFSLKFENGALCREATGGKFEKGKLKTTECHYEIKE